jgi:hypothetical protein
MADTAQSAKPKSLSVPKYRIDQSHVPSCATATILFARTRGLPRKKEISVIGRLWRGTGV